MKFLESGSCEIPWKWTFIDYFFAFYKFCKKRSLASFADLWHPMARPCALQRILIGNLIISIRSYRRASISDRSGIDNSRSIGIDRITIMMFKRSNPIKIFKFENARAKWSEVDSIRSKNGAMLKFKLNLNCFETIVQNVFFPTIS